MNARLIGEPCTKPGCADEFCEEHWMLAYATRRGPHKLYWELERWHVDGRGIHAGDQLELELVGRDASGSVDRKHDWIPVRIETQSSGQILIAYFDALQTCSVSFKVLGSTLPSLSRFSATSQIRVADDRLRWPERARR